MKINWSLLAGVVLALCLASLAFGRIVPASPVHAACEARSLLSSAGPSEKEAAPPVGSVEPAVWVATGLVCILFAILAAAPLLVEGSGAVIASCQPRYAAKPDLAPGGWRRKAP